MCRSCSVCSFQSFFLLTVIVGAFSFSFMSNEINRMDLFVVLLFLFFFSLSFSLWSVFYYFVWTFLVYPMNFHRFVDMEREAQKKTDFDVILLFSIFITYFFFSVCIVRYAVAGFLQWKFFSEWNKLNYHREIEKKTKDERKIRENKTEMNSKKEKTQNHRGLKSSNLKPSK